MRISRRAFVGGLVAGVDSPGGTEIVVRLSDRKLVHLENPSFAARAVLPPASTIKPFALLALLEAGKLRADDGFVCGRRLAIGGHQLNCVHPLVTLPMNAARAIAYSCNGAVAYFARRFAADELPMALIRYGFTSVTNLVNISEGTGTVRRMTQGPSCQLQAIGEEGLAVTPLELALGYARLAERLNDRRFTTIREGLEGAVTFGTAQAAQPSGLHPMGVAGKTGSILLRSGAQAAWFAGFAPSRSPKIVVVVLKPGRSGGSDAAPVAAALFERYAGRS